ncbi:MAG: hypothetical protein MSG64_15905 [Pyrinomonadaceae bacterium MAG19_C2-C3]|nr:hypothetical protein [Pyrinomonadaceae bacterium MAG19_C2-C3]
MRSLHIPMAREVSDQMTWRFGWKHEYWDGCAHITPRHNHVHVSARVAACALKIPPHVTLREVCEADAEELIDAFIKTFEDGVEFCDWETEKIHEHARDNITDFFAGRRGAPHLSSRVAVLTADEATANLPRPPFILAAALFTRKTHATVLDLLMVRPQASRQGIASLLVGAAMNDLHCQGETVLGSAYHVANAESAAWHQAFGFTEEPDLHLARLRRAFYYHEMTRCEASEAADGSDYAALKSEYEFWSARVDELEKICKREGYEAVTPSLRLDW